MSKVKIFVVYHKPAHVFKNEVFEPIQTGFDFSGIDLGFLKDNTGDNIAAKNPNYGELTAWYWIWKNWLPSHAKVEYIGFCHYRRFLDLCEPLHIFEDSYRVISPSMFIPKFNSPAFDEPAILSKLKGYDIALPPSLNFMSFECNFRFTNLYEQYLQTHPYGDFIKAAREYAKSGEVKALKAFWRNSSFHSCLNFIMRKEVFNSLCRWMFDFLGALETQCDWPAYAHYNEIRTPAFLAERYFDLWIKTETKNRGLRIRTCPRWALNGTPIPHDIPWYLSGMKQWFIRKTQRQKNNAITNMCLS